MNKLELAEQIYLDQIAGEKLMDSQLALKASYAIAASEVFYKTWDAIESPERLKLVGCKACFGSGGKKTSPCKVCKGTGKITQEA